MANRRLREGRSWQSARWKREQQDADMGSLGRILDEDFQRHLGDCKSDLQLVAKRLRVSYRAVQLRASKSWPTQPASLL